MPMLGFPARSTATSVRQAVLVCALLIASSGCSKSGPQLRQLESPIFEARVATDDKTITVMATDDSCVTLKSTSVSEAKASVTIRVFVQKKTDPCDAFQGLTIKATVHLHDPLGTRSLVRSDGSAIRLEGRSAP